MCNEKGETVLHIATECKKLAQRECKRRDDNIAIAMFVHWKLCENFHLDRINGMKTLLKDQFRMRM